MADSTSFNEDKLFLSKISDMSRLAAKRGAVYSAFLNLRECDLAEREMKRLLHENYRFYGVFENAERKMLCVYKEYFEPEDADFPIDCITFTFRSGNSLSHRDFLGALMALGIKRETIGDIVIGDGAAQIAACSSVKDVIVGDISKIGSVGVRYREDFVGTLSKPENFREINGTVASSRLDAVAGLALNLSRSRAAEIIKNIGAEVNFTMRHDCSYVLSEGDIFSVRGYGKFRLCEISGMTKKGRIHITVLKYC